MIAAARIAETGEGGAAGGARVGRDLLELVSTAMYVEPLTIFREYVQNAADSIDEAWSRSLPGSETGTVHIELDPASRRILIRDNGAGIPAAQFGSRMRALGASTKRGTAARGFRGVGRLAGLAYAQKLVFRSRAAADEPAMEIVWDCRRLRSGLKEQSAGDLAEFVEEITTIGEAEGELPDRFFEVEMQGVVRQGDDRLLREETVSDYLAQVAPLAFDEGFSLGPRIDELLESVLGSSKLEITVNDGPPLRRPHRDLLVEGLKTPLALREVATFEVPGVDGETAAVGWIAHHDYDGAIPAAALVKGLRVRAGDVQVGGSSLLQEIFPETRFCAWALGEVHVLDRRIAPNGRRDDFERNIHYANLLNNLAPLARDIARRCRTSSAQRQRDRAFEALATSLEQQLAVVEQGAASQGVRLRLVAAAGSALARLEKAAGTPDLLDERAAAKTRRAADLRERLDASTEGAPPPGPLDGMAPERRATYREVIDLIYQCSANQVAAKALVDRIMETIVNAEPS